MCDYISYHQKKELLEYELARTTRFMSESIILSAYTVRPLLQAFEEGARHSCFSPDLGLTTFSVDLEEDAVLLPNLTRIAKKLLLRVFEETQSCFVLQDDRLEKIATYSEHTHRYYTLYPTASAPTMLLSGIPMHRIKDTDPYKDTLTKMKAAQPVGFVLDTATGLGYTAITAARSAKMVITVELDPAVIELCRFNPWSKDLFDNPRISHVIGDSFEMIQSFPNAVFSRVIHDPPTFSLAGDLYSGEFYSHVYRVLRSNGRLFHYIGDPKSPSVQRVSRGIINRLKSVGFQRITPRPEAFGLVAEKR